MRRRDQPTAVTIEVMPVHLREFDAPAWSWSGPRYVDGLLATGYSDAWNRWVGARRSWCDANPIIDPIADVIRRHPDEPWPIQS